jgi:hypothetical protein
LSIIAAAAAASLDGAASAEPPATAAASKRRDVIKQDLPGEPARELILIEITYPPGTGLAGAPPRQRRHGLRGVRRDRVQGQ